MNTKYDPPKTDTAKNNGNNPKSGIKLKVKYVNEEKLTIKIEEIKRLMIVCFNFRSLDENKLKDIIINAIFVEIYGCEVTKNIRWNINKKIPVNAIE